MCTQVGPTWVGLWAPHAPELLKPRRIRFDPPPTLVDAMRDSDALINPLLHPIYMLLPENKEMN